MDSIPFVTAMLMGIVALIVFFYRLKYIKIYGLLFWGIALLIDMAFTVLEDLTCQILFPTIPPEVIYELNENLLLIIQLGLILLTYSQFMNISKNALAGIFAMFFVVWSIEFYFNVNEPIESLYYSTIFLRMIIVILVLWYMFELFLKYSQSISEIPFFWITLGWLVDYFPTLSANLPNMKEEWLKDNFGLQGSIMIIVIIQVISSISASCCYIIGFWKTKKWVVNQSTQ